MDRLDIKEPSDKGREVSEYYERYTLETTLPNSTLTQITKALFESKDFSRHGHVLLANKAYEGGTTFNLADEAKVSDDQKKRRDFFGDNCGIGIGSVVINGSLGKGDIEAILNRNRDKVVTRQ